MKLGAILALVVAMGGLGAMFYAFLTNASPYVNIAEAKTLQGDNLHVAGDLDKSTLKSNPLKQEVRFTLKDEKGDTIPVLYTGPPPSNMGEATKVVAIGGMENGQFHATRLLIKCPSKYESSEKPS